MTNPAAPGDLVRHWVEVPDGPGRTRLEARWTVVPEATAPTHLTHTQAA